MSFEVEADAYDRFMGRFSAPLAPGLADLGGVSNGQKALDVGCGPGALTGELVQRLGAESVSAVDPSESFVEAARARHPGVDVRRSTAEELPYGDETFDASLAQLVVHFMSDPVRGLGEMARVTRPDGVVAACVWDLGGDRAPLSPFWRAARELDPDVDDESGRAGTRAGQLGDLFARAGLRDVEETEISSSVEHAGFDEWWEPFTLGVGPAGGYAKTLGEEQLSELRERCRTLLPDGAFTLTTYAWAARGRV